MAMGHFFDGFSTMVVGTHTHVPTSDFRIRKKEPHIKPILVCAEIIILLLE